MVVWWGVTLLPLSAQLYSLGSSPAGVRWVSLASGEQRIIAPDYGEAMARKVLFVMDSLSNTIGYGLAPKGGTVRPLAMPVVMHAESSTSNGITIMAPQRIEINTMPAVEGFATPWLRHLTLHEYRHAAQYAALFDDTARWLYYLVGEQGLLAMTGVMPFWWLEGDAVDAETQATLFGRALQPSFTMHYRALGRRILEDPNPDKWFSGSYNEYIPNHYHLGYQMTTTANTLAQRYVWGEVMDYASRHPYTITPFEWAMRKQLGYSTEELFRTTFERLNDFWESLPERHDSAQRVATTKRKSHQTPYIQERYPLWLDGERIVVVESSFDTTPAFVEVDVESGKRRTLRHIGYLNSRPALIGEYIYWTEMQQLSSFAQHIGSVMCRAHTNGSGGIERVLDKDIYALFATNYRGALAYVRYNLEGTYTVVLPEGEFTLPEGVECHGLTAVEGRLYLLTTSDRGMAIESLAPESGEWCIVKPASRVTLSNLTSSGNSLFFGSIASGYDEIHTIDLATGKESRLTTSRYGSFYGSPSPDGSTLAVAVYDTEGYHLALSPNTPIERVANTLLPRNVVNPEVYRWSEVVCIDTLAYGAEQIADSQERIKARPYNKGANALNFHSWAPAYYRPEQLASGNLSDIRFGATISSQSLLSDAVTTFGVYYLPKGAMGANLNVKYTGLAPKFEFNAMVDNTFAGVASRKGVMMQGGDYHHIYDYSDSQMGYEENLPRGRYSLYGRLSLPIVVSNSYTTSVLTPAVEFAHNNNHLYSPTTGTYHKGQNSAAATLQWNTYTRSAYRNLTPRWGLAVVGGVGKCLAPFETTTTVGAFLKAYTPAFGLNDGFTLRASWQNILGNGALNYSLDFGWLTPRGIRTEVYPDDLVGYSVQYDTPLCYPDWGAKGIVMLKRVRASLFVDSLWGRVWREDKARKWSDATTFGADLWLDTSWLRLPEQGDLTIRLGLYFDTRLLSKPTLSGGLNLNF